MKKRFMTAFICMMLILSGTSYGFEAKGDCDISPSDARSAVVIEAGSGRVLYSKDKDRRLPMASTTKILTTLIALQQPDLQAEFAVKEKDFLAEGSSMGLRDGDVVNLEMLAYGMMLPSGNDAANAAAVKIAGSKEAFAELMNEKAAEIGMKNSHFVTPSGLDHEEHFSTAYDMALLTRKALENDKFREICGKYTKRIMLGNPPTERTLANYNKLLRMYPYCTGVKTGYTDNAGRCLVTSACKNGIELIAVTMNCHNDFRLHMDLYEYFFDKLRLCDLSEFTDNIHVNLAGSEREIKAVPTDIPLIPLFDGEKGKIKAEISMKNMIYPPVNKGDLLGSLKLYTDGELIYKTELVSPVKTENLNKKLKTDLNLRKYMLK